MITQIEIDGFKTFKDFKVELAPFQVIVGPNGSGKSTLFDALHLLSRLADVDLRTAFQEVRGNADEMFTVLPNGKHVDQIHIAVEMLLDRKVKDDWGRETELKYRRLRYELTIIHRTTDKRGLEQFYVTNESLKPIPEGNDSWSERYDLSFLQNKPSIISDDEVFFIDTVSISETKTKIIFLFLENENRESEDFPGEVERTILSSVNNANLPHAFAAREEMRSWKFLHLNPEALRQSSPVIAPTFLAVDGSNLSRTLARMQDEDEFALTDVSRDMANLVPGILKIKVEQDKSSNKYVIHVETSDHRSFSSEALSEGTLRLLALATLRNDPQFHGVLCLEEPENGVQPLLLKKMTQVLREMATDFKDSQQVHEPLRQVLINTHSPLLIGQPDVIDSLLLAIMPTRVEGENSPSLQVTRMVPVTTPNTPPSKLETGTNGDKALEAFTIDMVRKYLDSDTLDKARDQLKKARASLNER